jgi:hypothetical protein
LISKLTAMRENSRIINYSGKGAVW